MDKIIAPIRPQDVGPAVANLQQAMLLIVEKRQLAPASHTLASWREALTAEINTQQFAQRSVTRQMCFQASRAAQCLASGCDVGPRTVAVQSWQNSSTNDASGGRDVVELAVRARDDHP
jgi:hypothetical protein